MASQFIIDGYNLDVFNVKVSAVEGLDIVPKVKERTKHSWPDESGVDVDTSTDITYEAVTFSLKCRIKDSTYKDAVKRFNGLVALLSGDGYHLLGSITRGKLYPVVLDEVTVYKQLTATSANPVWIEFTLKLLCPLPECRMGSATVTASGAVSLNANTSKQVTIWWGDGTTSTGTGALNHTYTNAGTYTVLIAGTGVTKSVFTTTVITIDEYSYPASGDVQNVDVSHTSEETWNALQAHLANLSPEYTDTQITTLKSVEANGIIPNAEATWLDATAKSVLSYLQKLLSKVYLIAVRVDKIENGGEIIKTITLSVSASSIVINRDSSNNVFSLTGCELHIYTPQVSGTYVGATYSLIINNSSTNVTSGGNYSTLGFVQFVAEIGGYSISRLYYNSSASQVFCESIGQRYTSASASASTSFYGFLKALITTPINALEIRAAGANTFPAGTVITLIKK